jgi:hypothetical protein
MLGFSKKLVACTVDIDNSVAAVVATVARLMNLRLPKIIIRDGNF